MPELKHFNIKNGCYFITTNTHNRVPLFRNSSLAKIVVDAFYFLKSKNHIYLYGFVIMPDHFHLILATRGKFSLAQIMHSIKSYTAKEIDKILQKKGRIWQEGYYEHGIRNEKDFIEKLKYLLENSVKAGLAKSPKEYKFSSAYNEYEVDSIF